MDSLFLSHFGRVSSFDPFLNVSRLSPRACFLWQLGATDGRKSHYAGEVGQCIIDGRATFSPSTLARGQQSARAAVLRAY